MKPIRALVQVAKGDKQADLVLKNAVVVDVFGGDLIQGDVAIYQGFIAGVGSYEGKENLDLKGAYVMPGLIDAHVHIESSLLSPPAFSHMVVTKGTTTVIADPHEIANVAGGDGIDFMLKSSEDLPIDVMVMLPSCVPSTEFEQSGARLLASDLEPFMDHKRVLGLGEMMNYPGVLEGQEQVFDKLELFEGRIIDGHSPMLSGKGLTAYVASGVQTDHECTTAEEMLERIRRGMYVFIREGSATKNLAALIQGVTDKNAKRIGFCTDDKQPQDILEQGHINAMVNQAIKHGIAPVMAIQMATLHPATCYGLHDRGAVAPGMKADLLVCKDLTHIEPMLVYHDGHLVAKDGVCLMDLSKTVYHHLDHSINIQSVSNLNLTLPLKRDVVRVIQLIKDNITTHEVTRKVGVVDGGFCYDPMLDILKLAVVERHHGTGQVGIGLLEGYGLKSGAVGLSIAHDSHNIIVIGTNDRDMKQAVFTLSQMGGGMVIVEDDVVRGKLSLEIGGLMTHQPAQVVAKALETMSEKAHSLGVHAYVEPFMTLAFMALPVIPELKLTDQGLFDVNAFRFVPIEK